MSLKGKDLTYEGFVKSLEEKGAVSDVKNFTPRIVYGDQRNLKVKYELTDEEWQEAISLLLQNGLDEDTFLDCFDDRRAYIAICELLTVGDISDEEVKRYCQFGCFDCEYADDGKHSPCTTECSCGECYHSLLRGRRPIGY